MTFGQILAPVFVQVLLTFVLLFWMGRVRIAAVKRKETRILKATPRTWEWPERVRQVQDSFHNQLELPVLFYIAMVIGLVTRQADLLFVALGWVFVASRLVHVYIHTGTNNVITRMQVFMFGAIVLLVMWLMLAFKILLGGVGG